MSEKKNDTTIEEKEVEYEGQVEYEREKRHNGGNQELSEKEALGQTLALDNPPAYAPRRPQTFPIVNKIISTSLLVYPSEQSEADLKEFANHPHSLFVQAQTKLGHGMPLLETETHFFSSKFISVRRFFVPKKEEPFDKKVHYYNYCIIKKRLGFECSILTLEFLDHTVYAFFHHVMPVVDYEYRGVVYRYVHHNKYTPGYFKYSLLQLGPGRGYSLVDSWDKENKKLIKNHPMTKFRSIFSVEARKKTPELFQDSKPIGELTELKRFGLHSCEIVLDNNYSDDHASVNSVNDEMLVHLSVGLAIKRQEDLDEEKRRRSKRW